MSWTDERINTLKKMWQSGKSASEIAEKLGGVTRNAVIGKAHRLGLSGRPSPIKKVVKKMAVAPKKAAERPAAAPPAKAAAPVKKPVAGSLPATKSAAPKLPAKSPANAQQNNKGGAGMPPVDVAPLAALANATARKDGKIISILELSERLCRWPVGDPKEPGFGYCGADIMVGHVYCAEHVAIAFQAPNRKDKKPVVKVAVKAAEVPDLEDIEVEVEDDEAEDEALEDDLDDDDDAPVVAV